jgi:hypothetical protein
MHLFLVHPSIPRMMTWQRTDRRPSNSTQIARPSRCRDPKFGGGDKANSIKLIDLVVFST